MFFAVVFAVLAAHGHASPGLVENGLKIILYETEFKRGVDDIGKLGNAERVGTSGRLDDRRVP